MEFSFNFICVYLSYCMNMNACMLKNKRNSRAQYRMNERFFCSCSSWKDFPQFCTVNFHKHKTCKHKKYINTKNCSFFFHFFLASLILVALFYVYMVYINIIITFIFGILFIFSLMHSYDLMIVLGFVRLFLRHKRPMTL